jgi:hypothetical protein
MADASRPGTLVIGASRLGAAPSVSGAGTVVRLVFRALAPGPARIDFSHSEALDGALRPVLPLRTGGAATVAVVDRERPGREAD